MIAPLRLVVGQGVGRDISFNVEGTSLHLKPGTPCSRAGCGQTGVPAPAQHPLRWAGCWVLCSSHAKPSLCSWWGTAAGLRSGVPPSSPSMITGSGGGACRGNEIARACPELRPSLPKSSPCVLAGLVGCIPPWAWSQVDLQSQDPRGQPTSCVS